ncbi:Uncharacterised protein [Segatella copri]|nr:Uncharacterised protein [Segatella copri]
MPVIIIACHHIRGRILRYVTGNTIRNTEFQIIDPICVEELLLTDNPTGTYRPDRLVLKLRTGSPEIRAVPS